MTGGDESATWLELQDLRHRRISYVPNQLASRLEDQLTALKGCGYKQKAVNEQFKKALSVSREDTLKKVKKVLKEDRLILSLPYNIYHLNSSPVLVLLNQS